MRLLEAKESTNARIAACATEVVDAQFAMLAGRCEAWAEETIGALAELHAGTSSRPRRDSDEMPAQEDIDFAAPADILQSELPHLYRTERRFATSKEALVCEPHSLLVASREDGVRAVMNEVPVIPGRGVLLLRTASVTDAHWLLHDIRRRSAELVATAQGSAGRELSRRAFAATTVRWPPQDVREQFAQLADPLHERAHIALAENKVLRVLRERILDSFLSGAFPAKSAS
jgi:type I restriction enzyme S subunit